MVAVNALERTQPQYEALGLRAGWKLARVWKTGKDGHVDGPYRHYEFRLARRRPADRIRRTLPSSSSSTTTTANRNPPPRDEAAVLPPGAGGGGSSHHSPNPSLSSTQLHELTKSLRSSGLVASSGSGGSTTTTSSGSRTHGLQS
ncbi:hypothetical protein JCM11491_005255 [Sporobolomyces phaffii]